MEYGPLIGRCCNTVEYVRIQSDPGFNFSFLHILHLLVYYAAQKWSLTRQEKEAAAAAGEAEDEDEDADFDEDPIKKILFDARPHAGRDQLLS